MNIQKRINARKIILSYIYQYNFFCKLQESELIAVESLFIDNIYKTDKQKFEIAKKKYFEDIKKYFNLFTKEEDLLDFVNLFFNERNKKDIDFDYVIKIGKTFLKYIEEVKQKVNALTLSFNFDEMDTIDQSLFILGYTEWKEIETPKEILINEMIELAKRYSDDGSPKLINGIMHKIVNDIK